MNSTQQLAEIQKVISTTTSYNMRRLANVAKLLLERVEKLEAELAKREPGK